MPSLNPDLRSCQDALALIASRFATLTRPSAVAVPIDDALGRVLAEPLHADRDQPPFPRSTRDGFAIRSGDSSPANSSDSSLRVVGAIRAGEEWSGPALQPGQAIEVMTGAPVPAGADAVLMVEHTSGTPEALLPTRSIAAGSNIVPRGAEAHAGQQVLAAGTRLGPAELALAASIGAAELQVFARPVAAILSTGDELVPVTATPGPQQIRNSNAHSIAALVRASGGEPRILPPAADTRDSLDRALDAAGDAPMLILSGGVSAGRYDLVEPVLASRGAEFFFTGVAMQPGKPAVFGRLPRDGGTQWVFGLPGNPVSTQVTAMLFAMPMLRALGGELDPAPTFVCAVLAAPLTTKPGLTRFLPARLSSSLGGVTVIPTGWQGSGDLHSNARANCYLVVPPEVEQLEAGSTVQVLLR